MKRYLGLAQSPAGLRGCLLEATPKYVEPRPLYLNLTGGATYDAPLNHTLEILEWAPQLAWATPRPRDLPPYHPNAEPRRNQLRELELPPGEIDTILQIADRLQARRYHRAHLAAWLALRESHGAFPSDKTRRPDAIAWEWLQHLARVRMDAPF
jgi:hypothetical protein